MSKHCKIFMKIANNAYSVSHSHVKTKKKQNVNLQYKKIWSVKEKRWLKIIVSAKAIKSLHKVKL
uniref:Large ribosomal subunit protein bL28c n=1 Tax=Caloglossa intermedia TaxID=100879 RepID=A0A1Z1M5R5_9FLOR|nr:ribosomal protein L28 [Caloglossa intermedia]ARW61427.1 ribosomal protein L28 [Caloglossa intermedia]